MNALRIPREVARSCLRATRGVESFKRLDAPRFGVLAKGGIRGEHERIIKRFQCAGRIFQRIEPHATKLERGETSPGIAAKA